MGQGGWVAMKKGRDMNSEPGLRDVVENLRRHLGNVPMNFLGFADHLEDDVSGALAELADSQKGGVLFLKLGAAGSADEQEIDGDSGVYEGGYEGGGDEEADDYQADDDEEADDYQGDGDREADDYQGDGDSGDSLEDEESPFEVYRTFFPILVTHVVEVEEGRIWLALVAGTHSAPGYETGGVEALRAGELSPVLDANLADLKVGLLGIRWTETDPGERQAEVLQMLARLGVVTERGGQIYPTVAGMIALGKHPYWFIPGMRVELNLEGEEVCWRGSLSTLVDRASCATAPCLRTAPDELREILLNAILHRDWRVDVRDLPIKIDVSDGYLEASHPGVLEKNWKVGKSSPLNPTLFALACLLKLARGRGEGLRRIDDRLLRRQLKPLTLCADEGEVCLRVAWPKPTISSAVRPGAAPYHPHKVADLRRSEPACIEVTREHSLHRETHIPAQENRASGSPPSLSVTSDTVTSSSRSNQPGVITKPPWQPRQDRVQVHAPAGVHPAQQANRK